MSDERSKPLSKEKLTVIDSKWGNTPGDHFGYASTEERLAKRGMEDWEMLESIPVSQRGIPKWFIGVILMVLLVAIGLSFPFWGLRSGDERPWLDWGFAIAIIYLIAGSAFVWYMVNLYGSDRGGRLDLDKDKPPESKDTDAKL